MEWNRADVTEDCAGKILVPFFSLRVMHFSVDPIDPRGGGGCDYNTLNEFLNATLQLPLPATWSSSTPYQEIFSFPVSIGDGPTTASR